MISTKSCLKARYSQSYPTKRGLPYVSFGGESPEEPLVRCMFENILINPQSTKEYVRRYTFRKHTKQCQRTDGT